MYMKENVHVYMKENVHVYMQEKVYVCMKESVCVCMSHTCVTQNTRERVRVRVKHNTRPDTSAAGASEQALLASPPRPPVYIFSTKIFFSTNVTHDKQIFFARISATSPCGLKKIFVYHV